MDEYTERNKEIFAAHKTGESYRSLGTRYGLSGSRVEQICHREARKERIKGRITTKKAQLKSGDHVIEELFPPDSPKNLRLLNSLYRMGIERLSDFPAEVDLIKLCDFRGFGKQSLNTVIAKIQEINATV